MGWRESLRKGTFRGVPFEYENIERTGGRGVVVHNFPKGAHATEDMGLKERTVDLAIYVIGSSYTIARDALIAAFEVEGAGQLILPTGGGGRYSVDSYTSSESREAGGLCRFDVSFIEAGGSPLSMPVADGFSGVMSSGLSAAATVANSARRSLKGLSR